MSAFERPLKMTSHIVPYPIILVLLLYFNRLLHLLGQLSLAFLRGLAITSFGWGKIGHVIVADWQNGEGKGAAIVE